MKRILVLGIIALVLIGCNPVKEPGSAQTIAANTSVSLEESSIQQGIDFLAKGRVNEAIQSFQGVVAQDPENTEALFAIGQVYMKVGSFDNAISAGREILKRDPQNGDAYMMMAGCYDMKGDPSKAIDFVKVAIVTYQQKKDTQGFQRALEVLKMLTEKVPAHEK